MTPDSELISTDWLPGPHDGAQSPVVVSFTDFRVETQDELRQVFEAGLELAKSWPIMSGAVGMWLWGKPSEMRGGSVSVWISNEDLLRFVRWPVHRAIVNAWRTRIETNAMKWEDPSFDAECAWRRAEELMRAPRIPSTASAASESAI